VINTGVLKLMWDMKMRDMKMQHNAAGVENARYGKCDTKMQQWKMWEEVCMKSHNNIDAAEYIVC